MQAHARRVCGRRLICAAVSLVGSVVRVSMSSGVKLKDLLKVVSGLRQRLPGGVRVRPEPILYLTNSNHQGGIETASSERKSTRS